MNEREYALWSGKQQAEGEPLQRLPLITARMQTGPVQLGDDWPGVFVRGDEANFWANALKRLKDAKSEREQEALKTVIGEIVALLESCEASRHPSAFIRHRG